MARISDIFTIVPASLLGKVRGAFSYEIMQAYIENNSTRPALM